MGQRLNIIIVAEGAIDSDGNKITPDYIKDVRTEYSLLFRFTNSYDFPQFSIFSNLL